MVNKFVLIGCGSIAKCLIEIWNLEGAYLDIPITIIEPEHVPEWVKEGRKVQHIREEITESNVKELLSGIDENTLVIDLSVEVDCIMIIDVVIEHKASYVNTSLEQWQVEKDVELESKYEKFKKDTLYYREMLVEKKISNRKSKILMDFGMNPGMIQMLCLDALKKIAVERNITFTSYAELAKQLRLIMVNCVELDTTKTLLEPDPDIFYNTWSSLGFQAEATDHIMMGYGTHESDSPDYIHPTDGQKNVVFIAERGMNMWEESVTLDHSGREITYEGMLITHGESNTLSAFLSTSDNSYRPSVYYIYRCCDIALDSLDRLRENDYNQLPLYYVLEQPDIVDGYDSIGALLTFEDGSRYWNGTVISQEDSIRYGIKHSNHTGVQVAASLSSAIKYLINKDTLSGVLTPEDMPLLVFEDAKKYLGNLYSKWLK